MAVFRGKTEDAEAPILGASWWNEGSEIVGVVSRAFDTENGTCYVVDLEKAVAVNGDMVSRVSVGALTGFRMAMQAARLDTLLRGDKLRLMCTGKKGGEGGKSPMVYFALEVQRG